MDHSCHELAADDSVRPHGTRGTTIGRANLNGTAVTQHFIKGVNSPAGLTIG